MHELTEGGLFDGPKLLRRLLLKCLFGFGISKRLNHEIIVYRYPVNCKANESSPDSFVYASPGLFDWQTTKNDGLPHHVE